MKTFQKLSDAVGHLVINYRNDLLVHDRNEIEKRPDEKFLHWSRESGTHLMFLSGLEVYPAKGTNVPYLFGSASREHILDQKLEFAKYFIKCEQVRAVHYFNGFDLAETTVQRAVEITREYVDGIVNYWNNSGRDRA